MKERLPAWQRLWKPGTLFRGSGDVALGIHVEGPFVALSRKGGIPSELVREPSIEYLHTLVDAARRRLRVMTFARKTAEGHRALRRHHLPGSPAFPGALRCEAC